MYKQKTGRRRQRSATKVASKKLGAWDHICRTDVVAPIADRVSESGDGVRQVRDKVAHRLGYAIKTGTLEPPEKDGFILCKITAWASQQKGWAVAWARQPALPTRRIDYAHDTLKVGDSSRVSPPVVNSQQEGQVRLAEAYERIAKLEAELVEAREEPAQMRPSAMRYEANRRTNRDNAARTRSRQRR